MKSVHMKSVHKKKSKSSKKMATLLRLAQRGRAKLLSTFFPCPLPRAKDNDPPQVPAGKPSGKQQLQPPQGLRGEALVLASQLHGETFPLPNLWKVFAEWPLAANQHAERLEGLVDSLLERIITNERKLKALKQADFARLISLWYPDADWPELEIATAYSVWIFVWDDEVDAGDTDVSNDEELARAYYQKSLNTVRRLLDLDSSSTGTSISSEQSDLQKNPTEVEEELHINMALFSDVGRGMRTATDMIQRERFFRELENFMVQVGVEHGHRMRGTIPSLEKYMEIRSGSVGCAPQIALTDYMLKIRLPESIMEGAAMKALWKETVIICLILNDIYSVQKEIAQGSLFNIVPVMYKDCKPEKQSLSTVSHKIEMALQASMKRFEEAATSLDEIAYGDEQLGKDIQSFVKWCRYFITGVLQWSLESRRYGMAECRHDDGSLSIVL
ncbi:terpenoid synthase [Hypoxylon sp. FL1150]|nr:terpenoid synthase [Hypoxylon sp. FL1150]